MVDTTRYHKFHANVRRVYGDRSIEKGLAEGRITQDDADLIWKLRHRGTMLRLDVPTPAPHLFRAFNTAFRKGTDPASRTYL